MPESWVGIHLGHVGRAVLDPVAADIGTRITLAVFLVASVNFLGLTVALFSVLAFFFSPTLPVTLLLTALRSSAETARAGV